MQNDFPAAVEADERHNDKMPGCVKCHICGCSCGLEDSVDWSAILRELMLLGHTVPGLCRDCATNTT
jgi:heterodisulfide reductase subunit C